MILFDSNILVFAHNKASENHQKAKELREDVLLGKINGAICQQNLLEFYSIVTNPQRIERPLDKLLVIKILRDYQYLGKFKFIIPTVETSFTFSLLLQKYSKYLEKGAHIFDFYLAATAISGGVETIYTENVDDFSFIKELEVVNPIEE